MSAHMIKTSLAAVVLGASLAAAVTCAAPAALAEHGCHSNGHHGTHSLGDGGHGQSARNAAVSPLGCIPGSPARPCQGH